MLQFCVQRVMIVLAVILFASVAEEVFVAELAVANTGIKPLLLMRRRLSHRTVDALATAVDRDASRISWRRAVGLSDT
jgi:hypothetical protein